MPNFAYVAVGRDGKRRRGAEFVENRRALETRLRQQRLTLVECRVSPTRKVALQTTIDLVSRLSELIGNGIVVERALRIVEEDATDRRLSALTASIRTGVKRGQPLSDALAATGRFDLLLVPLIRAGEASGELGQILAILRKHYEDRLALRREVIAHLTYPAVLVAANLCSLLGLGLYVIPIFKGLFQDRMQVLPASTQMIFWISDVLIGHGAVIGITLLVLILLMSLLWRSSERLHAQIDHLVLMLPLLGPYVGKLHAQKIVAILGVLLGSSVPLTKALELTVEVVGNRRIQAGLERGLNEVRRGTRLSTALAAVPRMPKIALRFVLVGEETGNLGKMCTQTAALLAQETQARMKTMVTILEPTLIACMGGIVAYVVTSMLVGVYSISDIQ